MLHDFSAAGRPMGNGPDSISRHHVKADSLPGRERRGRACGAAKWRARTLSVTSRAVLSVAVIAATAILWSPGAARSEYREIEVKDGGKITGKVSFHGEVPLDAIERYPISGKSPGCGRGHRDVATIDVEGDALRGSFVLLDGMTEGKKWPQAGEAVLDQQDCRFVPALQIVRSGTRMTIRNSDDGVLHNINMRELIELSSGRMVYGTVFNIAQPIVGEVMKRISPKKSPYLSVSCELHNFMIAHVLAPEHPYAALVDDDGTFVLDNVPPGEHSVVAWHPKLGKRSVPVTVEANGTAEANFTFGE